MNDKPTHRDGGLVKDLKRAAEKIATEAEAKMPPPEVQAFAPPKQRDPALAAFDAELGKVQEDLNQAAAKEPPPQREPYPWVHLGEQVADAMVQAAEAVVIEAQSVLEEAKAHRDKLRVEIAKANEQIGGLTQRLKAFGEKVLNAHTTFHNGDKK